MQFIKSVILNFVCVPLLVIRVEIHNHFYCSYTSDDVASNCHLSLKENLGTLKRIKIKCPSGTQSNILISYDLGRRLAISWCPA